MRTSFLWSGLLVLILGAFAFIFVGGKPVAEHEQLAKPEELAKREQPTGVEPVASREGLAQATFGNGCFWCTEAVFQQLKGVESVVSGYSGGSVKNPTYHQVCEGTTGHAEAIQITYDPKVISYEELLEVFWQTHDPTTLNRQGNDVGTQYRSAIFYHTEDQEAAGRALQDEAQLGGLASRPVVTEIVPFTEFYGESGLPPELLRRELGPVILPRRDQAEARQDEKSVRGEAEGHRGEMNCRVRGWPWEMLILAWQIAEAARTRFVCAAACPTPHPGPLPVGEGDGARRASNRE